MLEGLDELMLAGVLGKRRVEMVKCRTVDLEVPANAQIVLEGYVEPGERRREGLFGDHTGLYSLADDFPVFHLQCITMRKNPDLRHDGRRDVRRWRTCTSARPASAIFLPLDPQDAAGDRRHALPGGGDFPQHRAGARSTSAIRDTRARS